MSNNISTPMPEVLAMWALFDIVDAVRGGTKNMRAMGETYLPRFPLENPETYWFRLKTSVFLPVYGETLARMVGRVFATPITFKDDVPPDVVKTLSRADSEGRNFSACACDAFTMAMHYGVSYILVDSEPVKGMTLAESKADPYLTLISPRQVLGWKRDSAGKLSQVRIAVTVTEDDGEFAVKTVETIKVLETSRWREYRKDDTGVWSLSDEGKLTLGYVPLVPVYANRKGFMTAEPPMLDLAYLNIKHWQSQSDQDNILHVARVPLLVRVGVDEGDDQEVSTAKIMDLPMNADMKYVEHSGAAIEAGRQSLKDLIEEMQQCGARLLQPNTTSAKTAAQSNEEAGDSKSTLAMIAESARDAFDQVLQVASDWLKAGADGGHVDLNTDLDNDNTPIESMGVVNNMVAMNSLSKQTQFAEAKRRGIVSEDLTWEDEQARINNEGGNPGDGY